MAQEQPRGGMTYAQAGVDITAADRFVARIRDLARTTRRPEVLADVGPFAGLFQLGQGYRDPVLVASADGVGTKIKLASLLGRYDTVGADLVNHCVNDILTLGAHPLFFLDYLAFSALPEDDRVALVQGMASACREVGCALLGGETAQMPDLYAPGDFDLAGFIVGIVEREAIINGGAISEGDVLLGLPSSGLHTNGYSLVRRIFGVGVGGDPQQERAVLEHRFPSLGATLGEALLATHRCYYQDLKPILGHVGALREAPLLKGIAHITGGGLPGNLPRILPAGLAAKLEMGSWPLPPIFRLIQEAGKVAEEEMYRAFNMGLGLVLAVAPEDVATVRSRLPEARLVGQVVKQTDEKRLIFA